MLDAQDCRRLPRARQRARGRHLRGRHAMARHRAQHQTPHQAPANDGGGGERTALHESLASNLTALRCGADFEAATVFEP